MQLIKKRGDTIIEVMMAVAVFAVLAIITINLMNSGLNAAQRTLEELMARNEIDSQAEALRYIHQSYVAERQLDKDASQFRKLWNAMRQIAQQPATPEDDVTGARADFDINHLSSCSDAYASNGMVFSYNAFVLNTRLILPDFGTNYNGESYQTMIEDIVVGGIRKELGNGAIGNDPRLKDAVVYPRIVYKETGSEDGSSSIERQIWGGGGSSSNDDGSLAEKKIYNRIASAEGVFIIAVGDKGEKPGENPANSNYFDFYIRTCWHSVGSIAPSTLTTIVRLYNPEVIE